MLVGRRLSARRSSTAVPAAAPFTPIQSDEKQTEEDRDRRDDDNNNNNNTNADPATPVSQLIDEDRAEE